MGESDINKLSNSYIQKPEKADVILPAKRGRKQAQKKEAVLPNEGRLEIVFVDVSNGEEKEQKESFINEEEAEAAIDYIKTHSDLDLDNLCLMSPFRT